MLIKHYSDALLTSEITPETIYHQRRELLKTLGYIGVGSLLLPQAYAAPNYRPVAERANAPAWLKQKIAARKLQANSTGEDLTPYDSVSTYNNFYEFGLDKSDTAEKADSLKTEPWTVTVEGLCNKTGTFNLEDILKPHALEDRIYRFRCVEAWSMVVPWLGFPLAEFIKRFEPKTEAKYIEFETLLRKRFFEFAEHRRQDELSRRSGAADPQLAALRLIERAENAASVAHGLQDCLGVRQQFSSGMGEVHALALAMEKLAAEVSFEGLDGVADGALREMQFAAHLRETAGACEADEGAKLACVDGVVHEYHSYTK